MPGKIKVDCGGAFFEPASVDCRAANILPDTVNGRRILPVEKL
jgi:hypothetical protein